MTKRGKKHYIMLFMVLLIVLISGCQSRTVQDKVRVSCMEYQPITYETVQAARGDISPVLDIRLKADDYEVKIYFPLFDEMEIASVNVREGDVVSAGTVMVSFKSGDIEEQIKSYKTRLDEDSLLLDHYTRLQNISSQADCSEETKAVRDDMEICSLYIEELEARILSYSLVAERNGIVSSVSDVVNYGIVGTGDGVVTVKYGSGQYTATVADNYEFVVGDIYKATYGMAGFDMELTQIEEQGSDSDGNPVRKLHFQVKGDEGAISSYENLTITIDKNVLADVLYVPREAINMVDENAYVYVVDDRGMRHAVPVVTGDTVDGYTVIKAGISEGDKVVID